MREVTYESAGKFLLFGEYLVLRGALCLAMPLSLGQTLTVSAYKGKGVLWRSFEHGEKWFDTLFSESLEIVETTDSKKAKTARGLLRFIQRLKPEWIPAHLDLRFDLGFERKYGMGSSATLVSLLSQWSGVDPYSFLEKTFGGSGFDVAAATAQKPFLYSITERRIREFALPAHITRHLLFIYTGKKQNSAREVFHFRDRPVRATQIAEMNAIVEKAASCSHIEAWEDLMEESEQLLSAVLGQRPVREKDYSDYPYKIKSLGAWGGDFIMASCRDTEEARNYFLNKNKNPVYTFKALVK